VLEGRLTLFYSHFQASQTIKNACFFTYYLILLQGQNLCLDIFSVPIFPVSPRGATTQRRQNLAAWQFSTATDIS